MNAVIKVLQKDISAAIEYLDQEKFDRVGMSATSIIDNMAMVGEKKLMIYGLLLMDVADELLSVKRRNNEKLDDCKNICVKFVKNIYFLLSEENDLSLLWDNYYTFKKEVNNYSKTEVELLVYNDDNVEFTKLCTSMLIEHLEANKNLILEEDNGLLFGILNELTRVMALYGFEERDLLFYLLLRALMRYYMIFSDTDMKNIRDIETLQDKIYPFLDRIIDILKNDTIELNTESNEIIGNTLNQSSIYIINYYAGIVKSKEDNNKDKMNLIPKKSRKRIGKILEEAIEKEVKK